MQATRAVLGRARAGLGGYACLGNAHVLVNAQHDRELRDALDQAWLVFADGAPVAWVQRRHGVAGAARVAGPDLMALVIERGLPLGLRHFLLGAADNVLARLNANISERFAGAKLVGSLSPSRLEIEHDDPAVVACVNAVRPDVVWCAFGAPYQELWMSRNATRLAPATPVGVGAAFNFLAGSKSRAPEWMQRSGLEWSYRLLQELRRLSGRYARTNTEFIARAVAELARGPSCRVQRHGAALDEATDSPGQHGR